MYTKLFNKAVLEIAFVVYKEKCCAFIYKYATFCDIMLLLDIKMHERSFYVLHYGKFSTFT